MTEIIEIGTISSRGQIAIPADMRRNLDLKEGEKVIFILNGDRLIIKKVSLRSKMWEEIKMPLKETQKKPRKLSSKEIVATLNKHKDEIARFGVVKIGLFGSFAKGKQNEKSDVDILVELDNSSFDNYMGLKLFLERLFKRKVDLVVKKNLKPAFAHVKKEVIYA
ncbi:hypothetical protein COX97_00410 [Candidatus Pacearchaeota archaeon CG_4_10_14_0_2_um_filter_05_32_18]|nr:MAG: hypothetical protein COX97_00410 [Candidatus Pacearchaeota archaeon CG_4_10_14_0_2_um_filter_05_32_18]